MAPACPAPKREATARCAERCAIDSPHSETNYDHWKPPGVTDDRRHPAERALERLGPEAAGAWRGLETVLSDTHCNHTAGERPVLNQHTVYTALMQPSATNAADALKVVLRSTPRNDSCVQGP